MRLFLSSPSLSYSTSHITSTLPPSPSFLHDLYNHLSHHLLGPTTQGASLERVVLHRHAPISPALSHSTPMHTPPSDRFSIAYTLSVPCTPSPASSPIAPPTRPVPAKNVYVPRVGVYRIRVIGDVSPRHTVRIIAEDAQPAARAAERPAPASSTEMEDISPSPPPSPLLLQPQALSLPSRLPPAIHSAPPVTPIALTHPEQKEQKEVRSFLPSPGLTLYPLPPPLPLFPSWPPLSAIEVRPSSPSPNTLPRTEQHTRPPR
jgi:hypothetical protein